MSRDELDKTIPVRPPTVNKKIKPKAHSIAGDHLILPPCRVAYFDTGRNCDNYSG